jgi:acyl-CoA synthetase (AMP-forming)/AMP-acid ligase II
MRPLPGVTLRIVATPAGSESPSPKALPSGALGEIQVAAPTLMQGYLDDPAATSRALAEGWLRTGDLGWLDAEGGLHVLDRREDLIVSGGENVSPAEVEAVLALHPDVLDVGVCGASDSDLGQRVAAHVVLREGAKWDPEALTSHCRAHLAGHKLPRAWHQHSSLPRNAAGKLLRRVLDAKGCL